MFKREKLIQLPTGRTEMVAWIDSLLERNGLPVTDSYKHAIATMVLHLPPTQTAEKESFFVNSIKKAMANQVAYDIIQELKRADAERAAKAAEPQPEAVNSDSGAASEQTKPTE